MLVECAPQVQVVDDNRHVLTDAVDPVCNRTARRAAIKPQSDGNQMAHRRRVRGAYRRYGWCEWRGRCGWRGVGAVGWVVWCGCCGVGGMVWVAWRDAPSAWLITAGDQSSSTNTAALAAVSVIPCPADRVVHRNTRSVSSVWKRKTAAARASLDVSPVTRTCHPHKRTQGSLALLGICTPHSQSAA